MQTNLPAGNNKLLKTYKAELMLIIVTLTWGLSFPLIKILLHDISPFMLVTVRFSITLVFFVIIFGRSFPINNFNVWKKGLILGIFLFLGYAFQTLGLYYTTASKSAFITGINLIFIPFIQYFVLRLKPGMFNAIGAVIVLIGLFLFTGTHIGEPNIGDIFTIFCAISFAVHIVLLSKYSENTGFLPLAFGQFLAMAFLGILSTLILEETFFGQIKFDIRPLAIIYLLVLSLISTLYALILMTKYQSSTTPFRAGIIYNTEAVFAAVFAYFLLGEILSGVQITAALIIIAGLMFAEIAGLIKAKYNNEVA